MTKRPKVLRKNQMYADTQMVFTIVRFKQTTPGRGQGSEKGVNR